VRELEGLNRQMKHKKRMQKGREIRQSPGRSSAARTGRQESERKLKHGGKATEEMFMNVFNSLRNYLMPPCEPRANHKENYSSGEKNHFRGFSSSAIIDGALEGGSPYSGGVHD
jgi:hypothetical protein